MSSIDTLYGTLDGVSFHSQYSNGETDGCKLSKKNTLATPYGDFVPQYETEDMGRRPRKPVRFHKSGAIKRVFPLDGKLSGFWSWKNEFDLAEKTRLRTPAGTVTARIIAVRFYENGALRSFEPLRRIVVPTPVGMMTAFDNEPNGIHGATATPCSSPLTAR